MADKIIEIYKNQDKLIEMKFNCLKEAKKYRPEEAMKNFIKEIE